MLPEVHKQITQNQIIARVTYIQSVFFTVLIKCVKIGPAKIDVKKINTKKLQEMCLFSNALSIK